MRYWYSSWMWGSNLQAYARFAGQGWAFERRITVFCGKYCRYEVFIFYFSIHYKQNLFLFLCMQMEGAVFNI
jgi:hypothetical protein